MPACGRPGWIRSSVLKADACMRQAGLDPQQRLAEIQTCKLQLQNTQDETQTLADLRKRLPAFSWKQELRDFPLFMAIYFGGLLGLYEHFLVPLAEHRPLQMDMAVTPGLLLQCVWVYLILKALLWLLALLGLYEHFLVPLAEHRPLQMDMAVTPGLLLQCVWVYLILKALLWLLAGHKPGWTYWSGIIAAFCLYLAGIWLSMKLAQPVLFSVNVWLLTAILALVTWLLWPGRSCTGHGRPFPRERRK